MRIISVLTFTAIIILFHSTWCDSQQVASQAPSDPFYLRRDQALRAKLSVEAVNPPVAELLEKAREATKLNLTIDKSLANHQPVYGSIQFRDAPAFALMGVMAERDIEGGHWEKTTDGYRLIGKSLAPAPLPPSQRNVWIIAGVSALGALLILAGIVIVRRGRRKAGGLAEAGA